jgi:gas vesicle protein
MDSKGDLLAGVIIGTVIGVLGGVLFAPAPGKETREKIAEKGMEVKEKALHSAQEHKDAIAESSRELIEELRKKLPKTRDVQDALDAAKQELNKDI